MPAPTESACGLNREQEGARADGEWDGRQHSNTSAMMPSASRICVFVDFTECRIFRPSSRTCTLKFSNRNKFRLSNYSVPPLSKYLYAT